MSKRTLTFLNGAKLCLFALALGISPAWANGGGGPPTPFCRDREVIAPFLYERYGEVPAGIGAEVTGNLLELFRALPSAPKDTWTLILHLPRGTSCIIAAGENWRDIEMVVPAGERT